MLHAPLTRLAVRTLVGALIVCTTGCLDRDLRPLNPCTVSGVTRRVKINNVDKVDLLFMVDNSNSMAEEQMNLAAQFPRMVNILATGDQNGDGIEDFPPVKSLQIGVVTSDMGTGGFIVPTCADANLGNDGILRTQGNTSIGGCQASYPRFQLFEPENMPGGAPQFANDVTCVANLGTNGCGFEQQLEAILKAVTPSGSPLTFAMGSRGHADVMNAGFVRPDSLLAIIVVTDEDDCSALNPDVFNPQSAQFPGDLNLRCFMYADAAVHPVQRYVDGLIDARGDEDLLIYAAITGIPERLVGAGFDAILSDPDMQEMPDPAMPTRLRPSCNRPGTGLAFPPKRIVQVAQGLEARGSNGIVQSICVDDFTNALTNIIEKIASALGGACLPRPLVRDANNQVNCDVVEILPPEIPNCDTARGRMPDEQQPTEVDDMNGVRRRCKILQIPSTPAGLVDPNGIGWFYDDFSEDVRMNTCSTQPQRISFSTGAEPQTGVEVRLECLQSVEGTGDQVTIGTPCAGGVVDCAAGNLGVEALGFNGGLVCEPSSNTCQPGCMNNSNCAGGYVCHEGLCVNPTCGGG